MGRVRGGMGRVRGVREWGALGEGVGRVRGGRGRGRSGKEGKVEYVVQKERDTKLFCVLVSVHLQ